MKNFEQINSFYLGSEVNEQKDELVLYDSKDLTTHAVIIGMTGSGKTGLGVCMIEEALLDGIPVIAVDPKGDLGNLLLTFPDLSANDFSPWIDPAEAESSEKTIEELAINKANLWKKGLNKTHQTKERIQALKDAVDMNLYTPGSNVGTPISLLKSLKAPSKDLMNDKDMYRERIASSSTGILSLLGIENDPLSREHILLNNILEYFWDKSQDIELTDLISTIQSPPFERIGVMDIEIIYPAKDRLKLAMKLNNLLASPGFESWTQGQPLDASSLLFGDKGKPQLSVMNIAHLSEEERLFFVTMLLSEVLAWMRTQPGTGSLRAILYIDEIFGYMPPIGNPSTKPLLLTLLKQARAYGVGIVLSTQNPVDLDYKGLSNAGTWFIGKLQTEQDRDRVMSGLLSATEDGFDKEELNNAFNQLGKRKFLMHNIHEPSPIIMTTRWAMSYLAGPLSRNQIKKLTENQPKFNNSEEKNSNSNNTGTKNDTSKEPIEQLAEKLIIPSEIEQYYLPPTSVVTNYSKLSYKPCLIAVVNIHYDDSKSEIHNSTQSVFTTEFSDGAIAIDWRKNVECFISAEQLQNKGPEGANHINPIPVALRSNHYKDWEKALRLWIRQEKPLHLFQHDASNFVSSPNENESKFRQRITLSLRESRDVEVEELRESLTKKLRTLEDKLQRAEIKIDKEKEQAKSKTMDAIIGAGTAIFAAFMSKKKVSATNSRRLGSALKKAKGAFGERNDIELAKDAYETIKVDITALQEDFISKSKEIHANFDASKVVFSDLQVYPKATGVQIEVFGIGWQPGVVTDGKWNSV